jgi:hypothetical protein
MRFSHAFGQGLTFSMGLLKYKLILDGSMSEFTSGDVVHISAFVDTIELDVSIKALPAGRRH